MREAGGPHQGTYDAAGGGRDEGEDHPVVVASRELSEETVKLLGDKYYLSNHIKPSGNYTQSIIANYGKRFVVYLTFDYNAMEHLTKNFYLCSSQCSQWKFKEKDKLVGLR